MPCGAIVLENIPINQHYVWRYYLEAWAQGGRVTCRMQSALKTIHTNPKNLASQRYFYGVDSFTDPELVYLRDVAERTRGKKVNLGFVDLFTRTTHLRRLLDGVAPDDVAKREEIDKVLRQVERGLGEIWHSAVERQGAPYLDRLRAGDASFWGVEADALPFCNFFATQYFRTARMRNAVQTVEFPQGLDIKRLWPVESHIWATEFGAILFASRDNIRATILTNASNTQFVTGDQPIINLKGPDDPNWSFYYPVSPNIALLLSHHEAPSAPKSLVVGQVEAERLNYTLYSRSDDQIYGIDAAYLEALVDLPKTGII
ncbi:MAG: DUF4238 domain-containing protein [Allgaiera sp.]|jgi:hypothetical protein|nr:DUF4238 domain-containing protein [Allgaiera sp.]